MFVRKRISPSSRQTPSYQVIETYRDPSSRKVKQRVILNLGHQSPEEALIDTRKFLERCRERAAASKAWQMQMVETQKRLAILEAVVSKGRDFRSGAGIGQP